MLAMKDFILTEHYKEEPQRAKKPKKAAEKIVIPQINVERSLAQMEQKISMIPTLIMDRS